MSSKEIRYYKRESKGYGRSMEQWFQTQEEAEKILKKLRKTKVNKDYK